MRFCMRWGMISLMCFSSISFAAIDVCDEQADSKFFMSTTLEGNSKRDVLSEIRNGRFSTLNGSVAAHVDLNGDGVKDYVYDWAQSRGSAGDDMHIILVQCMGYLQDVGAGYFAGVKVQEEKTHGFRDIMIYSHERDAEGRIKYDNNGQVTTLYLWQFNPVTKKYAGEPH